MGDSNKKFCHNKTCQISKIETLQDQTKLNIYISRENTVVDGKFWK